MIGNEDNLSSEEDDSDWEKEEEEIVDKIKKTYTLEQLETDYKKEISKFSPAYLRGSYCYVGPSFKEYYLSRKFEQYIR